ncbi:uncharacterized protein LOC119665690 [Teleopsis dalmanni]|uniref:uncharacterized protein LOC119665690 n=1 Tax=Teleopsis dalmanni TaxID=139649 RepID=UPI0018CCA9FA|nr:uncharacterized protein LOC119665690 [Teleopsis dalmanni]
MLKHASNASGSGITGHIRNNQPSVRNLHLRPQQQLNVSTIGGNSFQTTTTSTVNTTTNNGSRISTTVLNITAPSAASSTTVLPSVSTSTTTPPIANGLISNNLHNCHYITPNTNTFTYIPSANCNSNLNNINNATINPSTYGGGPREALTSLGLLCLVSLLFALLSLIFLLRISPNAQDEALRRNATEDFVIVYDVTLALCALSLSLNLCCLLVCAIQFLFAVKLVMFPLFDRRFITESLNGFPFVMLL